MSATYTQCRLRSRRGAVDTRWIPTPLAVVGKSLRVKATGLLWEVLERGQTWPEERVLAHERDWITMPTVTDAFTGKDGRRRLPVKPH
jgi:hypothetical protein